MPREPKKYGERPKAKAFENRKNAHQRGYGRAWRKFAAAQLAVQPLCEYCKLIGKIVAATCVDHARPHKGDKELFWDNEFVSSCDHHNISKGDMTREEFEAKLLKEKQ